MSPNLIRRGGLAAMLGGIVGILYFPFHSVAYFATEGGAESIEAPWVAAWSGAFRSIFEPLFTFASPDDVYMTYGKVSLFMVLGWLVGAMALHVRQAPNGGRLEKWGFRIAFAGLLLGTLGSIGEYWVGALEFSFFAFTIPGILLLNVGLPLFGIGTLRAKVAPRLGAWLLTIGGFPGIFLMTFLLGHFSGGALLLNLAWVMLGYALWSSQGGAVRQAVPVQEGEQA
jgi:hypothetical protein